MYSLMYTEVSRPVQVFKISKRAGSALSSAIEVPVDTEAESAPLITGDTTLWYPTAANQISAPAPAAQTTVAPAVPDEVAILGLIKKTESMRCADVEYDYVEPMGTTCMFCHHVNTTTIYVRGGAPDDWYGTIPPSITVGGAPGDWCALCMSKHCFVKMFVQRQGSTAEAWAAHLVVQGQGPGGKNALRAHYLNNQIAVPQAHTDLINSLAASLTKK